MSRLRWILAAPLLTSGCLGLLLLAPDGKDRQERFDEALDRWNAHALTTYTYEYTRSCFCLPLPPVRVDVRDARVVRVTDLNTGADLDTAMVRLPTIDDLFDLVRYAIDEDARMLEVTYDETWGFPARGSIDISVNIADEETAFSVTAFTPG